MEKCYFAILEVSPGASTAEIHSAYRRLAKEFHPDYYDGDSQTFRQIQEAYSVLGDPDKRRDYEKRLPGRSMQRRARHVIDPEPEPLSSLSGFAGVETLSPLYSNQRVSTVFEEMDRILDRLHDLFSRYGSV